MRGRSEAGRGERSPARRGLYPDAAARGVDLDQSPLPVPPDLAIEIVSKNDRADDLLVKVSQYLEAGASAVWLIYPRSRLAYRYVPGKREPEVRIAEAGETFAEPTLLRGFSLPLAEIFGCLPPDCSSPFWNQFQRGAGERRAPKAAQWPQA